MTEPTKRAQARTEQIAFRATPHDREVLEEYAHILGVTISELIRDRLEDTIEHAEQVIQRRRTAI